MARNILWAYGFDGDPEQVKAQVEAIGPTAFDTVMLPFVHVNTPLELLFNETPFADVWDGLAAELQRLKTAFPVKKQLLMSLGGAGSEASFKAIGSQYAAFVAEYAKFAAAHHIDGLDLDFEGNYQDPSFRELLALIASTYRKAVPSALITAAPYEEPAFWAGRGGVLAQALKHSGRQPFSWFNVQFYEGGYNQQPSDYLGTFNSWSSEIGPAGNGVGNPGAFVVAGCNGVGVETEGSFHPADVEAGLRAIRQKHSSIGGGFVWNYDGLEGSPAEWADAIANGCR